MPRYTDLTGMTFNYLTAVEHRGLKNGKYTLWLFECTCGRRVVLHSDAVRSLRQKSCGCMQAELLSKARTKHGGYGTPTYSTWFAMKDRCTNENNVHYARYGGRGIEFCERWKQFAGFLDDMGQRPRGLTLDRIDNDGNYEPENCRWATRKQQSRNTSATRFIELNGVRKSLVEWADDLGINANTLRNRLRVGRPPAEVLHVGNLPYASRGNHAVCK